MRIIDDEQVSTFTRDRATDTNSKVFPALAGIPTSGGLGIGSECKIRKNLFEILIIHDIPHLPSETHGKFRRMGGLDDFFVRVLTQKPSG